MINFGVRRSTVKVTGGLSYIRGLVEASFSTPWVEYLFMPPQAMLHRRHFLPCPSSYASRILSVTFRAKYIYFTSQEYRTDVNEICGSNHYHEQIKWLRFGQNFSSWIREKTRIDVNRFCCDVKQLVTPSEISLYIQRQMRSRTQFHVNLKIWLTNFM